MTALPAWNCFAPIRFPGGKTQMVAILLYLLGKCDRYCEPFAGGGSVGLSLRRRWRSPLCHFNDVDLAVHDFWLMLRDFAPDLHRQILSVWRDFDTFDDAIEFFKTMRPILRGPRLDQMQRAVAFYICNRIGYSGITSQDCGTTGRSAPRRINDGLIDTLPYWSSVLQGFEITNHDYRMVMSTRGTTMLIDPPYEDADGQRERRLYLDGWQRSDILDLANYLIDQDRRGNRWVTTLMTSSSTELLLIDKLRTASNSIHHGKLPVQHSIVHRAAEELLIWNFEA